MRKAKIFMGAVVFSALVFGGCGKADEAFEKAMQYSDAEQYDKAESQLKLAIKEDEDQAEYYISYALILNKQRKYKDALKEMEKMSKNKDISLSKDDDKQILYAQTLAYYGLGEYKSAMKTARKALDNSAKKELNKEIYLTLAQAHRENGDDLGALGVYDEYLKENTKDPQGYLLRGNLKIALEQYDSAKKDLKKAEELDDKLVEVKYYQGEMAVAKKDVAGGIKLYKEYLKKAGKNVTLPQVYYQLGLCYIQKNDYKTARKYFEEGLKCKNKAAHQYLLKNYVILLEKQGEYELAKGQAEKYLSMYSDSGMKKELEFIKTRIKKK